MENFVEHLSIRDGDQLLVSPAATRFLVVRHPFARLYAIWYSLFQNDNEGKFLKAMMHILNDF